MICYHFGVRQNLLLISSHPEDLKFWKQIADSTGMDFGAETNPASVSAHLASHREGFLFVDGKQVCADKSLAEAISRSAYPSRVFVITDEPINRLMPFPITSVLGHHVFRRYEDPASFLYSRLMSAAIQEDPSGLLRYFPEQRKEEHFELNNSIEKTQALKVLDDFLRSNQVNEKLVDMGVDAADELLMNAIFDAPYAEDRGYYRRDTPRSAVFDLSGKERVTFRMALCEEFVGISVIDQFGSLKRDVLLKYLFQDFRKDEYVVPEEQKNSGLGLHLINQQALALLFVSKPGVQTEVMVFFSNAETYREFRLGFCFFSVFAG